MINQKAVKRFRFLDYALDVQVGSARTKMVLVAMARKGNTSGLCFMSQSLIANEANCSVKSVERALKELVGRGLLMEVKTHRQYRRTKTYKLCISDGNNVQAD